ncbi:unnamed protein product [Mycena citricolor]|uniref:Inactive metallocarboxypeptidase ECM14 n=1 Tax=Mycena citricolor TaxID=2018698 RepID=A0AAD2Q0E7_9AGAR|nr:unnamed protein product [Mycena citricolor]
MKVSALHSALLGMLVSLPSLIPALEQHVFLTPPQPLSSHGVIHRFKFRDAESLGGILSEAESHALDIWQIRTDSSRFVDIYTPENFSALPLSLARLPHSSSNVWSDIPPSRSELSPSDWGLETLGNSTFHASYHTQNDVDAFMLELRRLHPSLVTLLTLGHTAEEREMLGLKISKETGKKKLGFVIMGPQHAREWVATSTALYIAHALLSDSSEPRSLSHLLDVYDFHIIPSPNPDGYVHTWKSDRFWYKNRQIVGPQAKCIGIDMNRWALFSRIKLQSYLLVLGTGYLSISKLLRSIDTSSKGYKWKPEADHPLIKANTKKEEPADPCSHWYPGHRAFESPEVNNIANYITKIGGVGKGAKGGVVAFLDLRSYGQMVAAPFSYKCNKFPKDAEFQMEALHGAVQAAKSIHGTQFDTGTLCELLYRAPGNFLDYVYKIANIKYAYAAFLRDTGTYGFSLPASWIRPVGEETAELVQYLGKFIAKQYGLAL